MASVTETHPNEEHIRAILERWAYTTRKGLKDQVLANHAADLVIFDVLPPLKYESAEAYRQSWDEWQPKTQGDEQFDLHDLTITAGDDVAFAFCLIRCGGTTPLGKKFEDWVRATVCFSKKDGKWLVTHQHCSMPYRANKG